MKIKLLFIIIFYSYASFGQETALPKNYKAGKKRIKDCGIVKLKGNITCPTSRKTCLFNLWSNTNSHLKIPIYRPFKIELQRKRKIWASVTRVVEAKLTGSSKSSYRNIIFNMTDLRFPKLISNVDSLIYLKRHQCGSTGGKEK